MASPSGKACSVDQSWHIGSIVTTDTELTGHGDCTVGIESRQAQDFLQMWAITALQATAPQVKTIAKVEQVVGCEQTRSLVAVEELVAGKQGVLHCTFNQLRQTY